MTATSLLIAPDSVNHYRIGLLREQPVGEEADSCAIFVGQREHTTGLGVPDAVGEQPNHQKPGPSLGIEVARKIEPGVEPVRP